MRFNYLDTLFAFSYALDEVEHDLVGVTTNHGKRVAYLTTRLGREYGLDDKHLLDLAALSVLHDNALTEYIGAEYGKRIGESEVSFAIDLEAHCLIGERNMQHMIFFYNTQGAIKYHHENADGSGPLGKNAVQTPLYARLIHLADQLDTIFDLSFVTKEKFDAIIGYLHYNEDILFDKDCVKKFLDTFQFDGLWGLRNDKIDVLLKKSLPDVEYNCSPKQLMDFASLFGAIVDYKSEFTREHSMGIAKKAKKMAEFYGLSEENTAKFYFAGAVHDIGKLVVDRDILEKPDRLTENEYKHIQTHAHYTYYILSKIEGMKDITSWASNHHEKLDGSGYPFGKRAKELGHLERVMACLDIYQALTEKRPYKDGMSHKDAMKILNDMVDDAKLDGSIADDMEKVFG